MHEESEQNNSKESIHEDSKKKSSEETAEEDIVEVIPPQKRKIGPFTWSKSKKRRLNFLKNLNRQSMSLRKKILSLVRELRN